MTGAKGHMAIITASAVVRMGLRIAAVMAPGIG
jgi:hypothetical protein